MKCENTGHPCGTDTMMVGGRGCTCHNCTEWLVNHLTAELAKAQAENAVLLEQNFEMNKTVARMRPHAVGLLEDIRETLRDYESGKPK